MVYPVNYFTSAMEGAKAVQDMRDRRQQQQQQLMMFQQAQQDRQRQQAAQAAAGNALPQLFAGGQPAAAFQGQMPPPPQPPAPGQSSQPMQQAGGGVPLPQGAPPGQGQPPPLPPGGVQGQMPPAGLPPFRPMPSAPPQSAAPQSAIPAPPPQAPMPQQQNGPLTMENAIKLLQDQGLSGADLMTGLQQLQPVLDSQAKAQAAQLQQQFNNEIKLQTVQDKHDQLRERMREADQRSEDRALDRQDRAAARAESNALRAESINLRKQQIALMNGDDTKFSPEELSFFAQQGRKGDTTIYHNLGRGVQGARNNIALRREVMRQTKEAGGTGADIAAANASFQGEKAAARAAGTRAANIGMAAAEAQQTFPLAKKASAALPRTEFPGANRAIQAVQTGKGDTRVLTLGTALNASVNAYARAISPSGIPTVPDKKHARELLFTASTADQLDDVLDMMENEMKAAKKAPAEVMEQQKERISGRTTPTKTNAGGLSVGTIDGGYRFKGGRPSSPSSWERAQ